MNSSGYPVATAERDGLMSKEQAEKLDGIPPGGGGGPIDSVTEANGLDLTSGVLSMGAASSGAAGAMAAADKTKLDGLPGNTALEARFSVIETDVAGLTTAEVPDSANRRYLTDAQQSALHSAVTLDGASSSWLTLVGQVLKLTLTAAGAAADGIVTQIAQTFAGVKTFTSAIIASAGIQVGSLWNTNGTGASDVGVKVGFSTVDGSVNANAHPFEVSTGIGGTESKKFWVSKSAPTVAGGTAFEFNGDGGGVKVQYVTGTGFFGLTNGATARLGFYPGTGAMEATHVFTGHAGFVSGSNVQLNTSGGARPTANAANRGTIWYSRSAGGVADTVEICVKSAADTYSWITIATG